MYQLNGPTGQKGHLAVGQRARRRLLFSEKHPKNAAYCHGCLKQDAPAFHEAVAVSVSPFNKE